MDLSTILRKVCRHAYLRSGIPVLRDSLKKEHYTIRNKYRHFDLDRMLKPLVASITPSDIEKLRLQAAEVRQGRLHIFDEPSLRLAQGVFRRDPRSGREHGLPHWSRVRISSAAGDQDVKFIWEVNRLCDLDALIACTILDGDSRYLEDGQRLLHQWRKDNPFNRGINWFSNMEVAIRLLRLLLLRGLIAIHNLDTQEVNTAIQEHYAHIESEWLHTKGTMGGNHLIIELAAMAVHEFLEHIPGNAAEVLKLEAERQFFPDGGHFEGSVGYHVYVLNALLFSEWLVYSAGGEGLIPTSVFERAISFLERIVGPGGRVPGIGDWDDGYVFKVVHTHPRRVDHLVGFGRHLLDLYCGNSGRPMQSWSIFPDSGLASFQWSDGSVVCFRNATVCYGLSHLDMLSLHYIGPDGAVVLDGGTYAYNYSQEVRNFYRFPSAHSTLFAEGNTPLRPFGNFAWKGVLRSRLMGDGKMVAGEYSPSKVGSLRREVRLLDDALEVCDTCAGKVMGCAQYIVPKAEITNKGVLVKTEKGRPAMLIQAIGVSILPYIEKIVISEVYGKQKDAMAIRLAVNRKLVTILKIVSDRADI